MTAPPSIDLSGWLSEQLAQASPDLLRQMITTFVQASMGAEALSLEVPYQGRPSPESRTADAPS
jgi:putative transposase